MKKFLLVLVLVAAAAGFVTAQEIEFGKLPPGKWLDPNYDAVWEVTSSNIRILDINGKVLFEFRGKTNKNFSVGTSSQGPYATFSTEETGKTYKFTKPVTNKNVILEIDRPGQPHYMVDMKPFP
jgi:hypothetical protein